MSEEYITDNNKWISAATGEPIPLTHQQELEYDANGPADPDHVANPALGKTTIVVHPDHPPPKPNTPGNPYFGKLPMSTDEFWALVGQSLPAGRFKRLIGDSHFLWVNKVMDNVSIVDADDRKGKFLKIVSYLTSTAGDDANVLVTAQEISTIMTAWK